jgi:pilus assembly protein CpaE
VAISVLIVDDQLPFRIAARAVVGRTDGFEVIGELADGETVAETVLDLRPDLVLMDVMMPIVDGIEATRQTVAARPETAVFLCSTYPLEELPAGAVTSGATAYLRKEQLSPTTLRSLWDARGETGLTTVS